MARLTDRPPKRDNRVAKLTFNERDGKRTAVRRARRGSRAPRTTPAGILYGHRLYGHPMWCSCGYSCCSYLVVAKPES
eukprot:2018308-Prymnesium_polylepis.1